MGTPVLSLSGQHFSLGTSGLRRRPPSSKGGALQATEQLSSPHWTPMAPLASVTTLNTSQHFQMSPGSGMAPGWEPGLLCNPLLLTPSLCRWDGEAQRKGTLDFSTPQFSEGLGGELREWGHPRGHPWGLASLTHTPVAAGSALCPDWKDPLFSPGPPHLQGALLGTVCLNTRLICSPVTCNGPSRPSSLASQ